MALLKNGGLFKVRLFNFEGGVRYFFYVRLVKGLDTKNGGLFRGSLLTSGRGN
jgi:hypothetical protein